MKWWLPIIVTALLGLAGCGTFDTDDDPQLVVEAFFETGKPLPAILVRSTGAMDEPYDTGAATAVTDAEVYIEIEGRQITYQPDGGTPGKYVPVTPPQGMLEPGTSIQVHVNQGYRSASANVRTPQLVRIDEISFKVSDEPIEAVIADSIILDSIGVDPGVVGYIYLIEVTVSWHTDFMETDADSSYWIRMNLRPQTTFSSELTDFFLRKNTIIRERTWPMDGTGHRKMTGIYAVQVESATAPLPPHRVRIALVRSGRDYAEYALSRETPDRREPKSNIVGGIGIAAGISLDSLVYHLPQ